MSQTSSAVYNPPRSGFPYLAVTFNPDGGLVAARAFTSRDAANGFLQAFMQENAGEHGLTIQEGQFDQPSGEPKRAPKG